MSLVDRDAVSTDALLTDLYLDALLAGAVLDEAAGRTTGGNGELPATLDPAARVAAHRLRDDLVRVHPSFRFEERLAARLAEAAVAMRLPAAAGAEGRVIPFRAPVPDTDLIGPDDDTASGSRDLGRPLLIGGALTSAALSIAGAAFVAWRRGRPGRATPMVKAARRARSGRSRRQTSLGPLAIVVERPRRRAARNERPD